VSALRSVMQIRQLFSRYDRGAVPPAEPFVYCPYCREELASVPSGGRPRPTCPRCGYVQYANPAPTVSVLIVDGDRVLLGKRSGPPWAGEWMTPSGYIEYDEDLLSSARREVKEETGLEIEILAILNVISSFLSPRHHFLAVYLLARPTGGELRAADDLSEVAWFPIGGPLPELGFEEDVHMLELWRSRRVVGLPVEPHLTRAVSSP